MIHSGIIASVPPYTPPDLPPNTRRVSGNINGQVIWEFQTGIGDSVYTKSENANNFRAIAYKANTNGSSVVIRNVNGSRWNSLRQGAVGFIASIIIYGTDQRASPGQVFRNRVDGIGAVNEVYDNNIESFTYRSDFASTGDCVITLSKVYNVQVGEGFIVNYIGLTY